MNASEIAKGVIADIKFKNGKGLFNPQLDLLTQAQFKTKPPVISPFPESVTTVHNTIWLSRSFIAWASVDKEAILIHESVHLKQYKDGVFSIYDYLTYRPTRFKLEIEAERTEIIYRCYTGNIIKNRIGDYAIQQANIWPKNYMLTSLKTTAEWYRLFRDLCEEAFKTVEAQKYL